MNKIESTCIVWTWGNVVRLLVGGFMVLALGAGLFYFIAISLGQ